MKFSWKNCFRICLSVFILFLCMTYWEGFAKILGTVISSSYPIVLGLIIAYVLNILMSFYERHYFSVNSEKSLKNKKKKTRPGFVKFVNKSRRPVCLIAAIFTLLGIIALVVGIVLPELTSCIAFLVSEIPPAIQKALDSEIAQKILSEETISQLEAIDWKSYLIKITETLTSGIGSAVDAVFSAITSVISTIVTIFISIIFSIYMLTSKEKLMMQSKRLMRNYLKPSWNDKITHWFEVLNDCFHNYITGQCLEALILGLLCCIGMAIFKFPYAMMIGTLIGFTALIPIAGAYIGAAVGAIMIFTISPIKALLFLVFIIILQQLEGNLIYPKVVGSSIGLPAIWVLAAVTIGGGIMGVTGMLIGVPIAAAVYRLVREDLNRRENKHSDETVESIKNL